MNLHVESITTCRRCDTVAIRGKRQGKGASHEDVRVVAGNQRQDRFCTAYRKDQRRLTNLRDRTAVMTGYDPKRYTRAVAFRFRIP